MELRWKLAQWFEAWWWRRYLHGKPVADYLEWKKSYWSDFLANAKIQVQADERMLDAGCGPAGIFMILPGKEVLAIDPLLEKYRSQLPHFQALDFPNVGFRQIALEDFSNEKKFDKIFCINAINHVADLDVCLKNLHEVLKPDGQMYLTVDAHNFSVLKRIFRLIPGDILHPHQLDLEEYLEKSKTIGFHVLGTQLLKHEFIFDYHLIVLKKLNTSNS